MVSALHHAALGGWPVIKCKWSIVRRLVFIGRNLDAGQLNASFRECLVDPAEYNKFTTEQA